MYFYLTFDVVCDEIESRVYSCANDAVDYSINDMLPDMAERFCLDFPEETAKYGRDVIASVFEMKADAIMTAAVYDRAVDYFALESEYYGETVQLTLF